MQAQGPKDLNKAGKLYTENEQEKAKDKTDLECYHTTNHNPNYAQTTNTFWYCMWKGWPLC
jgi:hypothetical protein